MSDQDSHDAARQDATTLADSGKPMIAPPQPGHDFVDGILGQWQAHAPDVDTSPMSVTSRIWRLAALLDRDVQRKFRQHEMHMGEFDVLASLYRSGPPYTLHPQQLTRQLLLTSGAMTHRLDTLEKSGLIRRTPNPEDRRSVIVTLTPAGEERLRTALQAYMADMAAVLTPLDPNERQQLAGLLKKLLLPYDTSDERRTIP